MILTGKEYLALPRLPVVPKQATLDKYGLTKEEFCAIWYAQGGKCFLCNRIPVAIDHCHTAGKVRGLLCDGHNTGLGKFGDSVEMLQKAIDYLQKP